MTEHREPRDILSAPHSEELSERLQAVRERLEELLPGVDVVTYTGELTVVIAPEQVVAALEVCRDDLDLACELLSDLSGVHWPGGVIPGDEEETTGWPTYSHHREGRIELDYLLTSVSRGHRFRLRANVPDDAPTVASASGVYASAIAMEREVYDMLGVTFTDHPNLTRVLMPEDWEGFPHRKDYPLGGVEVMYKGHTIAPPDERDY